MAVDVLMSYAEYIKAQTGFVVRNAYRYDNTVEDDLLDYKTTDTIRTYDCENIKTTGVTIDKFYKTYGDNTLTSVIVLPATNAYCHRDSDYYGYAPTQITAPLSCFHTIYDYNNPDAMSSPIMTTDETISRQFYNAIANGSKIIKPSYFLKFPFDPKYVTQYSTSSSSDIHTVDRLTSYAGNVTIDLSIGTGLYYATSRWYLLADFTCPTPFSSPYNWLNAKTKIELFVPYNSWITLDPLDVIGERIRVYCLPVLTTGDGFFYVTSGTRIIWSGRAQIAQMFPLDSDNSKNIRDNMVNFGISSAVSAVSLGASIALAPATAGMSLVAGGIGTVASMAGKAVSQAVTTHPTSTSQSQTPNQGEVSPYEVLLRMQFPTPLDPTNSSYPLLFGRPLHKCTLLSTLSGFTKVTGINWTGDVNITKTEQESLNSLLASGVYL